MRCRMGLRERFGAVERKSNIEGREAQRTQSERWGYRPAFFLGAWRFRKAVRREGSVVYSNSLVLFDLAAWGGYFFREPNQSRVRSLRECYIYFIAMVKTPALRVPSLTPIVRDEAAWRSLVGSAVLPGPACDASEGGLPRELES